MRNLNVLNKLSFNRLFCTNKSNVLVFNRKSKTNEPLKSNRPLTWYVCGPTVYDSMHIGHARFVFLLLFFFCNLLIKLILLCF